MCGLDCGAVALVSLIALLVCGLGLFEPLDDVGDVLLEVVVDVDAGRERHGLEDCCACVAKELSWKLVVLPSQSCSICVWTGLCWKMGSQCFFNASAIAVGVVASSSSSVRMAPMLLVATGIKRANLAMSCCFLGCCASWSWWSSERCACSSSLMC